MKTYIALLLGVLGMALAACPHSPPLQPSPSPHPSPSIPSPSFPACPISVTATATDVCDGRFIDDGHACVRCQGGAACIDKAIEVYCVSGGCADPACHFVAGQ